MNIESKNQSETAIEEFVEHEFDKRRFRRSRRKSAPGSQRGPLPLVIGITGHRDLREDDTPQLQILLQAEFRQLQKTYPSTPLIVLSALADGADRLGAKLALAAGLRLVVPLPMPQAIYEADFSEESLLEFRELLSKAEHQFELTIPDGTSEDELRYHGIARDRQFAQLGAYLAMHSEILIALWDGVYTNLPGGTSQIVRFKLESVPEPFSPPHSELDAPDSGPVYHIVTPRLSHAHTPLAPLSVHKLYPKGFPSLKEAETAYSDIYARMEDLNRDALRYSSDLAEHRRISMEYIFPSKLRTSLPPMLQELLEFYSIADVLSQRFQKRTRVTMKSLLLCLLLAAGAYDIYGYFSIEQPRLLVLYPLAFMLAFLSHYWAAQRGYQTKYLDYRALAEGLRVQFFWKLAGLKDSVADFYMRKQKSELDWIRNAIRSTLTERCADISEFTDEADDFVDNRDRLALVLKHWVEDQANYFAKAARRDHKKLGRNARTVTWLFGATLVLACIQLFVPFERDIMLVIGLLPVIAAVLLNYAQKNALAEQTKQFDRMSVLFHRARNHMQGLIQESETNSSNPRSWTHAQLFLAELGREALSENGDWILMHRDRPLEVPKGA